MRGAALRYGGIGWSVFPCRNKRPLVKWRGQSTSNATVIDGWWHMWRDAQIGVDTGKSGLVVIDLDGEKAAAAWAELAAKAGIDSATVPTVATRRGAHLYFAAPPDMRVRNSASKLGPGIDVRGDGGFVVVPPSAHDGGRYTWRIKGRPPALPPALRELLTPPPPKVYTPPSLLTGDRERAYADAALRIECANVANAGKGARNKALHLAAYKLSRFIGNGLDAHQITSALLGACNGNGLIRDDGEHQCRKVIASSLAAGHRQ